MNLTESKDVISSFLKRDNLIFNLEQKQNVSKAVAVAVMDFNALIDENKQCVKDPEKFSDAILGSCIVCDTVLDAPISDNFSIFVAAYSALMYNWNENTYKDPVMRSMMLMLSRLIESRDLFIRTTGLIKEASTKLLEVSNWAPPSYDIAKTYLENLLEQNEKEKKGVVTE